MILLVMMSCQEGDKFDLSKIDDKTEVSKTLNSLNISDVQTQNGYWELVKKGEKVEAILQDNGNISTVYSLKDEQDQKLFNFDNFNIEKNTGGKIVENSNKIVFVNIVLENIETFNVLKKLKEKLGNPDQIINDSVFYNEEDDKVKLVLKNYEKNDIKIKKDEFEDEYLIYPLHYVWNINGYIYKYTLFINEASFSNDLVIISNKAFNEKLIFGYHNPKEDSIFKKYYNE
ncbi:hypothetical protein LXD69_08245 [Flavobacterium sediminilitoris]|uniref:Lipoprotein n=1 Tax=Flavobacterium sediminilitoris TaxID=2024526 RepID=A0ABY4HS21_9FLAO|nr:MULTISPECIES: hypothetical protein [Flavobacterium]UOX35500.1 hypothetical protein LXD69_08245 [Flavobacterium sediminilitoris]